MAGPNRPLQLPELLSETNNAMAEKQCIASLPERVFPECFCKKRPNALPNLDRPSYHQTSGLVTPIPPLAKPPPGPTVAANKFSGELDVHLPVFISQSMDCFRERRVLIFWFPTPNLRLWPSAWYLAAEGHVVAFTLTI
mmetsp:Transcript_25951/g.60157  ORF Transcript_25951/g.60157 Transcript_25951/m.60157 type:complete len:139 (-) Transcript_25951:1153-1569(-)